MDRRAPNDSALRRVLVGAIVLVSLAWAGRAMSAERLPGAYEAEVIGVAGNGTLHAAVRTWFGQVALVKVTPRSVAAIAVKRECGAFIAGGMPAIDPGKRVLLSDIRPSAGRSGYVADVRYHSATDGDRSKRAGIPAVLRGGKAAPCRPRQ